MTRFVNIDGTYHNVSEIKEFHVGLNGIAKITFKDGVSLTLHRNGVAEDILGYEKTIAKALVGIDQKLAQKKGEGQ